ncbi:hypothetical protein FF80_00960 [Devosia sp. LC5]|nr:hypothetical protein FF80_00960 [Devosia sp. LC5]
MSGHRSAQHAIVLIATTMLWLGAPLRFGLQNNGRNKQGVFSLAGL